MALVFCDGFDSYAATADLLKKWIRADSPWAWSAGADQNAATGGIISCASPPSVAHMRPPVGIFAGSSRIGIGFWLKVSATPAANVDIVQWFNVAMVFHGSLRVRTTGALELINASTGSVFIGTTNVCDNAWHWIEVAPQIGVNVLQRGIVDSTSQWNGNGSMASSGVLDRLTFLSIASRTMSISDVMLYNDSGTFTVATNFPLTARRITTKRPDGDDVIQLDRSTGSTSYTLIDETNADTSDYVAGFTAVQDTYNYAALGISPTTVNAVMVNSCLMSPLPGILNFKQLAKSNVTTAEGTSLPAPPITPRVVQQPFYVDPNTAAAWTQAGIDAAKFGIKIEGPVPAIGTHRYWRIYSTYSLTNICVIMAEVQLRTSPGGADQTGSGTATGMGTPASGAPAFVVDNDPATTWQSPVGPMPAWWAYDFGGGVAKDIVEVTIQAHPSNAAYTPCSFQIQWSDDNSVWTTVWGGVTNHDWVGGETRTFTKQAEGAPYWGGPGGQGNRLVSITATTTATVSGTFASIVGGTTADNMWWNSGQTNRQVLFDFGVGASKVIDGFAWFQDIPIATLGQGTWVMEGSNDNVSYTTFPESFIMGDVAIDVISVTNSTGYRYYRLRQTAGVTSNSSYLREIEFRIIGPDGSFGLTNYANPGGTGNRASIITITTTIAVGGGAFAAMIDGTQGDSFWFAHNQSSRTLTFDFGVGASKIIDEFTWYQNTTSGQGTWQLQGSNDDSSYTTFPESFTLGVSSAITVVPITNSTGYRYYRLNQTAGITNSAPYVREIEFKISA